MATSDDPESAKLAASLKETEWELHQCKEELARVGDDLSIMINCYKEAQLIASKTKERQVAAQEADVLAGQPPGPAAHGDDAQDAHADSFQTCSAIAAAGSAVGEARGGVGSGVRPGRHRVMP